MIERCDFCGQEHETNKATVGGMPIAECPEMPENMAVLWPPKWAERIRTSEQLLNNRGDYENLGEA